MAFADYLQPKAQEMIPWNGTYTAAMKDDDEIHGRGFLFLAVCDQLFAVIIQLRRGLDAIDVSIRFGISKSTYSRMFATWIIFLSKELWLLFPFPSRQQVSQWIPPSFRKHLPNTRIIIDCYKMECQRPSSLMNLSITLSQYKSITHGKF